MIFTLFLSKNSTLQDPVLKSLVNKCHVCFLWPYFSDFKILVPLQELELRPVRCFGERLQRERL